MPSRLPCPRTCASCGRAYTILSDARRIAHRYGRCPTCRARTADLRPVDTGVAIEQAIARGLTGAQVMERLGVSYQDVWRARRRMEGARVS